MIADIKTLSKNIIEETMKNIKESIEAHLLALKEEKEFDAPEKENMRAIEEVYGALSSDKEIQAVVEGTENV